MNGNPYRLAAAMMAVSLMGAPPSVQASPRRFANAPELAMGFKTPITDSTPESKRARRRRLAKEGRGS